MSTQTEDEVLDRWAAGIIDLTAEEARALVGEVRMYRREFPVAEERRRNAVGILDAIRAEVDDPKQNDILCRVAVRRLLQGA